MSQCSQAVFHTKKRPAASPILDGMCRRPRVRSGGVDYFTSRSHMRDGPTTVASLFDFMQDIGDSLWALPDTRARFLDTCSSRIDISTDYSGIDAPMIAMARVQRYVQDMMQAPFMYTHYSSCEVEPSLQALLADSFAFVRPQHIFGDILDRIPKEHRCKMDSMLAQLPPKRSRAKCPDTDARRRNVYNQIGEYMRAHKFDIFGKGCSAPCRAHGGKCCLVMHEDPLDVDGHSMPRPLKLNISGPICCGWSSIGQRHGLSHPSAYPWHCFLTQREVADEDMFIIENSVHFPPSIVVERLGHTHELRFIMCGPEDLGWPTTRKRIYIIGVRRETFIWAADRHSSGGGKDDEHNSTQHFLSLFGRSVQLDGDIFLLDDDDTRRETYQACARAQTTISPNVKTQDIKLLDIIPACYRKHYYGYMQQYQASESLCSCFIADLHQNPCKRPMCGYMLPTQLTHGLQYSFSAGKVFTHKELLAAMGNPVLSGFADNDLWPYQWYQLRASKFQHASGNTMHGHVVSAVLMYALSFSARRSSTEKMFFLEEAQLCFSLARRMTSVADFTTVIGEDAGEEDTE